VRSRKARTEITTRPSYIRDGEAENKSNGAWSRRMPLARYFLYVGGVLLALLFIGSACLPNTPPRAETAVYLPPIRIHSDRKWPERIVFDTAAALPRVAEATSQDTTDLPAASSAVIPPSGREALAQLQASEAGRRLVHAR
jgi:hypothetical protein